MMVILHTQIFHIITEVHYTVTIIIPLSRRDVCMMYRGCSVVGVITSVKYTEHEHIIIPAARILPVSRNKVSPYN